MSENPLSSKVALDTTSYKAGVAELNRQVKIIETGFRAAAAGMGDWDQQAAGLEKRIAALTGEIGLNQQKVDGLKRVYQELAAGGKTSNTELEYLAITINRETEQLNKNKSELKTSQTALAGMGQESKKAGDETKQMGDHEKNAIISTDKLNSAIKGLANGLKTAVTDLAKMAKAVAVLVAGVVVGVAGMVAAAAAATIGLAVGLGALVLKTAASSKELEILSAKTGLSTDRLQELQYIADQTGTDMDTMTLSYSRLIKNMDAAKSGKSGPNAAAEAFADLGIKVRDSNGNLRDARTVWAEAITAIGKISDPTEADAIALQLFGKSALDLNPLIAAGAAGLADMATQAHAMGAVMSEEDVAAMAKFKDKLDGLKSGFHGVVSTLASAFMPAASSVLTIVQDLFGAFKDWLGSPFIKDGIKAINDFIGVMVDRFQTAFNGGGGDEGILGFIGKFVNGFNGMRGISPIFSVIADAVQGLASGFAGTYEGMSKLQDSKVGSIFIDIGRYAQDAVKWVKGLFKVIFDPTAGGGGAKGISSILDYIFPSGAGSKILGEVLGPITKIIGYVKDLFGILTGGGNATEKGSGIGGLISKILGNIVSSKESFLQTGLGIVTGLVNGIVAALPGLLSGAMSIIQSLVGFIVTGLPVLMQSALSLVITLVEGIMVQLPALVTAAVGIIVTLAQGISDALPQLMEMIATILPQVIITLIDALPALIGAALQLIVALVDGLMIALPILIEYAPKIIAALIVALLAVLPLLGDAAVKLILALILGIDGMLPVVGNAAGEIVGVLVKGIGALILDLGLVGASMVEGIWQGIKDKADWFHDVINGFFQGIIDGVKNALKGHSPSMVFADIGKDMVAGLGLGFAKQFGAVQDQIQGAIAGLAANAAMNVNVNGQVSGGGGGQSGPGRQVIINLGGIHVANGDPKVISQAAELGVRRALRASGVA